MAACESHNVATLRYLVYLTSAFMSLKIVISALWILSTSKDAPNPFTLRISAVAIISCVFASVHVNEPLIIAPPILPFITCPKTIAAVSDAPPFPKSIVSILIVKI